MDGILKGTKIIMVQWIERGGKLHLETSLGDPMTDIEGHILGEEGEKI